MHTTFEANYRELVYHVFHYGEERETRNGKTKSMFAKAIVFTDLQMGAFPVLTGRKYNIAGVLGEFAAFIRGPKRVEDFKKFGCNYWDMWAKTDGSINVDYGNEWIDSNGVNQIEQVIHSLKTDPHGRRHLITGWQPSHLAELDLPCCHYAYQWYVRTAANGKKYLDMLWHQRSADLMLGVPADAILAALWTVLLAKETGYLPGVVTMTLGDVHIYDSHMAGAHQYLARTSALGFILPTYELSSKATLLGFTPDMFALTNYHYAPPISFELLK